MECCFGILSSFVAFIVFMLIPASAGPITPANCSADLTACYLEENVLYQLPFIAISGDVIVTEADMVTVSDVFRIENDIFDTGGGTGLGTLVFLFSVDELNLPDPSTYSANATFMVEGPSGITDFNGNGTDYFLGVPEPSTFVLLSLPLVVIGLRRFRYFRAPRCGLFSFD
jgi:hypothetical protein